ncbi:YozE family protein [Sorangium sp. So ce136]|uniref:YozE family protein n=1 Tax=Sorangium sp. So ce136 TaxID=3133284 RepID=UPI003F0C332D
MGVEMPSCHLKQIVTAIPMAHAVVLAERWFRALSDDVSVFTSLYRWLVETRHVAPAGLHDRTYAGAGAARRLLAAERARIARRTKLRGAALDRAVNLSDLNAGPQTLFAERRLLGDALVVVPDDDGEVQRVIREMLQDDSDAQTRKARSIASGADFGQWLASNAGRDDPVGDLADDMLRDPGFPRSARHYQEVSAYLLRNRAPHGALAALGDAWKEYAERYPARVARATWCARCELEIEDLRAGILAWTGRGGFEVRHAACAGETPEYELDLQQLLVDDPALNRVAAFGERCGAPPWAIAELQERLRLWGFSQRAGRRQPKVYFIQAGPSGPIKIGYSGGPVERRLAALQTGHPETLCVLATMDGDRFTEAELHRRFHGYRLSGEWFKPEPDLMDLIAVLQQKP